MSDVIDLSARRPHLMGKVQCEACGEECISVRPVTLRGQALQCSKCGAMAMKEMAGSVNGETSFLACTCGHDGGLQVVVIHDPQGPIVSGVVCPSCEQEIGVNGGRLVMP